MQRIVVLGGGVGGTLVANLLVRKLKSEIDRGNASVTVVDEKGEHIYQPGFMYIAMGNEKPERLKRSERSLLDDRVRLEVGRAAKIDVEKRTVSLDGDRVLDYDQLILATGSRIVPEEIEHFETEAHHFYSAEAVTFPLRVCVERHGQLNCMDGPAPHGACNFCHAPGSGAVGDPRRIAAP